MDGEIIDFLMVLFSLVFNIGLIFIFVLRGQRRTQTEAKLGPIFNLLLIPFSSLWLLNLLNNGGLGRLITVFPTAVFLAYDLWYRTLSKKKPYHHPEHWSSGLYVYLALYLISGIMLNGYAFLASLLYGFIVLSSYYGSLMAYGYYQYSYRKFKQNQKPQQLAA